MLHVFVVHLRCMVCNRHHYVPIDVSTGRWEGAPPCNRDLVVEVVIPSDLLQEVIDQYLQIVRVDSRVQ